MKVKKIIIGLEVHIELKTLSKMFCSCSADHFAKKPNSLTCPVCLGLPGALPVPNQKAIEWTIVLGLALGGKVQPFSRFDRKNYFYPDLPKGYQISQYEQPFIRGGKITLDSGKEIGLRRVHLEEDTAKLLHQTIGGERWSLIDFNRSGVPLVEVVSEPQLSSSQEAKEYLEKLHQLVRYLEISDADMEKGSMRFEPNVNLEIEDKGKVFQTPIVEIKNINSFRFAQKAIDFEVKRQLEVFEEKRIEKTKGNKETRGWHEEKQITVSQRVKEEASDYRYFPEPDIPPFVWSKNQIAEFLSQAQKVELPEAKKQRLARQYRLTHYQANILTREKKMADYFEETARLAKKEKILPQEVTNVIINKRAGKDLSPQRLVDFMVSSKKKIKITKKELEEMVKDLLEKHPQAAEGYKKGKPQALGIIVGLIKKKTGLVVPIEEIARMIE